MATTKAKSRQSVVNPLELGREAVRTIGQTVTKSTIDEAGESGKTFLEQLLGLSLKKDAKGAPAETHADAPEQQQAQPNGHVEIFNFQKHQGTSASEKPKAHAESARPREAAIEYHREIVKNREKSSKSEMREMSSNIEQIKVELKKLIESSQVLKLEFAEVTVEQTPTVSQYHLTFFEWMLAVIRSAREKVEDSGAWLGTVQGKGAKKGYWGMFKKHGTTFGLSGERAVATQVG